MGAGDLWPTQLPRGRQCVERRPCHYWSVSLLATPIYASIIYFLWAGQLHSRSAIALSLAAVATLGLFTRMILEEKFLTQAYAEYTKYKAKAKRLIPFVY